MGTLKTVHLAPIGNERTLHQRILNVYETIPKRPGTFTRVRQIMIRCVRACIDSSGGHFEHLLCIVTDEKELNSY